MLDRLTKHTHTHTHTPHDIGLGKPPAEFAVLVRLKCPSAAALLVPADYHNIPPQTHTGGVLLSIRPRTAFQLPLRDDAGENICPLIAFL